MQLDFVMRNQLQIQQLQTESELNLGFENDGPNLPTLFREWAERINQKFLSMVPRWISFLHKKQNN